MTEPLRGDRVVLRPVEPGDLDRFERWTRSGGDAVLQGSRFLPTPRAGVVALIEGLSANTPGGSTVGFAIETLDGELIGHLSLRGLQPPTRIVRFGIFLDPARTGEGFGTDATRMALGYAFGVLGANRVELDTWAFSTRAIRSYEKAGFVVEGRQRAGIVKDGRFMDVVLMGVLAGEWAERA